MTELDPYPLQVASRTRRAAESERPCAESEHQRAEDAERRLRELEAKRAAASLEAQLR